MGPVRCTSPAGTHRRDSRGGTCRASRADSPIATFRRQRVVSLSPPGTDVAVRLPAAAAGRDPGRRDHDAVVEAVRRASSLPDALVAEVRELIALGRAARGDLGRGRAAQGARHSGDRRARERDRLLPPRLRRTGLDQFQEVPRDLRRRHADVGVRPDRDPGRPGDRTRRGTTAAGRVDRSASTRAAGRTSWARSTGSATRTCARQVFAVLDGLVGDGRDVSKEMVVERDWLRPLGGRLGRLAQRARAAGRSCVLRRHGLRPPGPVPRVGQHRRPHPEHGLAGSPRPAPEPDLPRSAGPRRPPGPAARAGAPRDAARRPSQPTSTSSPSTGTRPCTRRCRRTPGPWRSAGSCTRSSSCATASRSTATCGRSSCRSTATSASCSRPRRWTTCARYGPIGCRDWTTVDVLLSLGVPAFFSGCLTTTISTVFPDLPSRPGPRAPVAYVDVPAGSVPPGAEIYRHSSDAVRFRSFTDNVYVALELLETYRRKHSGAGDHPAALLAARPLDRRSRRLPAQEPLGHPLRRPHRHHGRRVQRHPGRHQRQARARPDRDPVRTSNPTRSTRCGGR